MQTDVLIVGAGPTGFFLVRPDGHIGLAGGRLDAGSVDRYFSAIGLKHAGAGGGSRLTACSVG